MSFGREKSIVEQNRDIPLNQSPSKTPASTLQQFLDEALREKATLRILEAGCGSASHLRFPIKEVHLTGIDISQKQLDRNLRLDQRIRADIQYYDHQPLSYDLVVCYWVLEHLPKPDQALRRFAVALDEGGFIVLAVPNILSVKGLLTKFTPLPIHNWVYRHLHGSKTCDQDDTGPFRTYLRYSIRPNAIRQFAKRNGLHVVYFSTSDIIYSTWHFKGGKLGRVARATYRGLRNLAKVATLGLLSDSDFYMVLQKTSLLHQEK